MFPKEKKNSFFFLKKNYRKYQIKKHEQNRLLKYNLLNSTGLNNCVSCRKANILSLLSKFKRLGRGKNTRNKLTEYGVCIINQWSAQKPCLNANVWKLKKNQLTMCILIIYCQWMESGEINACFYLCKKFLVTKLPTNFHPLIFIFKGTNDIKWFFFFRLKNKTNRDN